MRDTADSGSRYHPALPTDQPDPGAQPVPGITREFFLIDHLLCATDWEGRGHTEAKGSQGLPGLSAQPWPHGWC